MSFVRLQNKAGIGLEKLNLLASKEYKDLRLPIDLGNLLEKLMPESIKLSRGLLILNSGTRLVRFGLKPTLRDLKFGSKKKTYWKLTMKTQFPR